MRPMLRYVSETIKIPLTGIEIGVWKGKNAKDILDNMNIKMLYLIDPWATYRDGNIIKVDRYSKEETMNDAEKECREKLKDYSNITFVKGYSSEKHTEVPDVDFTYIDGAHDFRSVYTDIKNYTPKSKIIGGHDFNRKNIGVILAVLLYASFHWKILMHKKIRFDDSDWWYE